MYAERVTGLLEAFQRGDDGAADDLFDATYSQLHDLAAQKMRQQRSGHTLSATSLIHEATMKILAAGSLRRTSDTIAFYALAARAMRSVLVDHARRRNAAKRPTSSLQYDIETLIDFEQQTSVDVLALDEALKQLESNSQRQHDVVVLRFFGGLSFKEIATYLKVSVSTIEKDWNFARSWLRVALDE